MARPRVIKGATRRLDLSDDDWIEVRERLTYGQQVTLNASVLVGVQAKSETINAPGGLKDANSEEEVTARLDQARWSIERIMAWVVDWSIIDEDGQRVRLTRDAVRALDPETGEEIQEALNKHIDAMDQLGKVKKGK
jgi:hypothetical protein